MDFSKINSSQEVIPWRSSTLLSQLLYDCKNIVKGFEDARLSAESTSNFNFQLRSFTLFDPHKQTIFYQIRQNVVFFQDQSSIQLLQLLPPSQFVIHIPHSTIRFSPSTRFNKHPSSTVNMLFSNFVHKKLCELGT